MAESSKDSSNHDLFVTEFPKGSYDIDKYLQGRVHFALMDQIKLMDKLGKNQKQIEEEIMKMVYDIVSNFDPKKESESSWFHFCRFHHDNFMTFTITICMP